MESPAAQEHLQREAVDPEQSVHRADEFVAGESFDAVICQSGLMFFTDQVGYV